MKEEIRRIIKAAKVAKKKRKPTIIISKKDLDKLSENQDEEKKEEKKERPLLKKLPKRKFKFNIPFKFDTEDKETIKEFLAYVSIYGFFINFAVWIIFGFPFEFYSWIGWGLALWLIERKFTKILRSIIRK